jgi:hypothetical protein
MENNNLTGSAGEYLQPGSEYRQTILDESFLGNELRMSIKKLNFFIKKMLKT